MRLLAMRGRAIGRRTGDGGQRAKRATEKELKEAILRNLELLGERLGKKGISRSFGAARDGLRSKRTAGVLRAEVEPRSSSDPTSLGGSAEPRIRTL